MATKKILFFSGSVGLGHVVRDIAIANELRSQYPNVEISWLAIPPASQVLKDAGEYLLSGSKQLGDLNKTIEGVLKNDHHLSITDYFKRFMKIMKQNFEVFHNVIENNRFYIVIGDETFEVYRNFRKNPSCKKAPFVFISDVIGMEPMGSSLMEKIFLYIGNRGWSSDFKARFPVADLSLFVGEVEDVPDKPFGFLLPNRRDYAKKIYQSIGYIPLFKPSDYNDVAHIRNKLGYSNDPLIICSVGGTATGKEMLELCGKAYSIVKQSLPDLQMLLVTGPRIDVDSLEVPEGVEVTGYVSGLYEHFAACDLAIVQGGGTITLELTALKRPFIYFPIQGHFEQEILIAERLKRHRAGIKMMYSQTTPEMLAEKIIANIGKDVDYADIPIDGAKKAAQLIGKFL